MSLICEHTGKYECTCITNELRQDFSNFLKKHKFSRGTFIGKDLYFSEDSMPEYEVLEDVKNFLVTFFLVPIEERRIDYVTAMSLINEMVSDIKSFIHKHEKEYKK